MEAVMTGPESLMVPSRSKRTAVGRIGARPVVGAVRAGAVELGVTRLPVLGDGGIPPGSHLPPDLAMMPVTPAPTIGYCDVHNSIRRLRAAGEPRVTRAPKEQDSRKLSGPHTAAIRQLWKAARVAALTDGATRAIVESLRSRDRAGDALTRPWRAMTRPADTTTAPSQLNAPGTEHLGGFAARHIGPRPAHTRAMLETLGHADWQPLLDSVPADIRQARPLALPPARTEAQVLARLRELAERNVQRVQMIGQGYYATHTPPVIQRNVLESPAWYTAYTPYQPEISQGRLEGLLNFQTVVADLTALPVANASDRKSVV